MLGIWVKATLSVCEKYVHLPWVANKWPHHLGQDTHLYWDLMRLDSSWCGIIAGYPPQQKSPHPRCVHQRGKFNSLLLNLCKLQIFEWKLKLAFVIQDFCFQKIFKNVLQFPDEQWSHHPLVSQCVSIVPNFATFAVKVKISSLINSSKRVSGFRF